MEHGYRRRVDLSVPCVPASLWVQLDRGLIDRVLVYLLAWRSAPSFGELSKILRFPARFEVAGDGFRERRRCLPAVDRSIEEFRFPPDPDGFRVRSAISSRALVNCLSTDSPAQGPVPRPVAFDEFERHRKT